MLATAIIVFREAIEAGLIVGIVLAATRGVPGRVRQVTAGVAAGVAGACVVAMFAGSIAELFDGAGQEIFNAAVLLLAVVMLTWHVVWMASHGREMAAELRRTGADVAAGRRPVSALSVVVGVAVLREGFEVVLFLYGIAVGGAVGWQSMLAGATAGLLLAAGLTVLTYAGLVRLPAHRLFTVTGWMVTLLACGLAAQAAGFLQQGGVIEVMGATLWDTSSVLATDSIAGRVLHTLVGYTDRPTGLQVAAYLATLAAITLLSRRQAASAGRNPGKRGKAAKA
ncbi:MAG: FTR1 family iron permease [Janthinobacterium lividum]